MKFCSGLREDRLLKAGSRSGFLHQDYNSETGRDGKAHFETASIGTRRAANLSL